MREYAGILLENIARIEQEGMEIHDRAAALPHGEERDLLVRQWALARGEVRGLGIALERLAEYLREALQALEY